MTLRNRVALVTGGSRGIGRGIAVRLAQNGARVAIAYRSNKAAAQQTLRQLQASGGWNAWQWRRTFPIQRARSS